MCQPPSLFQERIEQLETAMHTMELDAIILNPGPGFSYLSGLSFHLSERPVLLLLVPGRGVALILPELELAQLEALPFPAEVFSYGERPEQWPQLFKEAFARMGLDKKRIGLEPEQLRLLEYQLCRQAATTALFQDAAPLLSRLRSIKSEQEQQLIQRAVTIAEQALETTLETLCLGMSERELAAELFIQLLREGSEPSLPFMPIVASGPNSANPHAVPGERRLQPGDALIIDWGASHQGYVSDLTRTFAVGEENEELQRVHAIVQEANGRGREAGKPGLACAQLDRLTREVIETAGYGPFFTHRTGHGLGLECHESPYIRQGYNHPLQPGMTYTVEPGIYLKNQFGVRIEDDIVVTATGSVSLSSMNRNLTIVG
ncbi:M24 family metallopeptidase [Desulfogranum mediterraneum]|uniref:M24 family metallopeptidase n=1 Tax=Desulfogranum mediterraneum TaxID=160661 RepID=UPI00041279EF|nr:Xaa-Pro peptidase family protein [Desulfogranum mediterraneum]